MNSKRIATPSTLSNSRQPTHRQQVFSCCLIILLLHQSACSSNSDYRSQLKPASGTLTQHGKPLSAIKVTLVPIEFSTPGYLGSIATTDANGHFDFRDGKYAGALPGDYRVAVSQLLNKDGKPHDPISGEDIEQLLLQRKVKEKFPKKFSDQLETTLRITIPPDGSENLQIKLE